MNQQLREAICMEGGIKSVYKTTYGGKRGSCSWKSSRKAATTALSELRRRNGMDQRTGKVKGKTNVLLREVSGEHRCNPTFFHCTPHLCIRYVGMEAIQTFREIERRVGALVTEKSLGVHRYGANNGVSLGLSVVSGGIYARGGYSGSIHCASLLKSHPALRDVLWSSIRQLLEDAFGNLAWYKRAAHVCQRLNSDSGEERTVPGCPVSGIWLTLKTKQEAIHCDRNIVGPIFVFSTYQGTEGEGALCTLSPNGNAKKCWLAPGMVLGGTWGSSSHCNLRVNDATKACRTSWTIYLDERVFGSNYKFVVPEGFVDSQPVTCHI